MKPIKKIHIACFILNWILNAYLILAPIQILAIWLAPTQNTLPHLWPLSPITIPPDLILTPLSKFVGISGDCIHSLVFILGSFILKKIMKNYRLGSVFSLQNAQYYQKLGWLCFFNALIIQPLSEVLVTLAISLSRPTGQRFISISIQTYNIQLLVCGLIVLILSYVMVEGHKLQSEQELTV